jgi:hypothetical protein
MWTPPGNQSDHLRVRCLLGGQRRALARPGWAWGSPRLTGRSPAIPAPKEPKSPFVEPAGLLIRRPREI